MTQETPAVISVHSKSPHSPGEMPTPLFPPQVSTSSEEFAVCFLPPNALHITSFLSCQLQKYVAPDSLPLSFVPDLASLPFFYISLITPIPLHLCKQVPFTFHGPSQYFC